MKFISVATIVLTLITSTSAGASTLLSPNAYAAKQCQQLKDQIKADARVRAGEMELAVTADRPEPRFKLFYWVRPKAQATNYPPLLLIHGGVGGTSSTFLTWKAVIDRYPGDVVSLDNRGEGCSNFFDYMRPARDYDVASIDRTVEDLEVLRRHLYGNARWRIFGQSRGSAIAHRYLEQHPASLESVAAHGLAMLDEDGFRSYSISRSFFNARAGRTFLSAHPKAEVAIELIREWLRRSRTCFRLDYAAAGWPEEKRPKVCGVELVDAFSGRLSAYGGWQDFAASLEKLVIADGKLDVDGAQKLLQATLDSSLYTRHMGYILGSNSLEWNAPNIKVLEKISRIPEIASAPLSEGRFILNVIYPIYAKVHGTRVKAGYHRYPFAAVRSELEARMKAGDPLRFAVFASEFDPVAGPEAFTFETRAFKGIARFVLIKKSGHDGWKTHPEVAQFLLQR